MKKHSGFIVFFTFLVFVFLWKIIIMRGGFIAGDYFAQFYPWSKIFSESIKRLELPFWTRFFHSGFPLMAEGQVGGFYPLNLIFFFFLPFHIAYNYIVVFHFALAGIFTYAYARKMGACQWGGALAALLFCFGSAYAGCFYNIITVKTLIWVPLVLLLFEKYFEDKKARFIIGAGAILGIQLLAGFAQMAFYSAVFYLAYFIYGLSVRKELKVRDFSIIGAGYLLSAIIFLPQFILSWPLAGLSGRADATLGFALWGSFPPLNFLSVVFPYGTFHWLIFYIGIFSLLFLIVSFISIRSERAIRPLFLIFLLSIFLALGKYNPLYVLLLKTVQFYGFRNPSKILFFGVFASSVLSGWGFTKFFKEGEERVRSRALRVFSFFIGIMLGLFFLAKVILVIFKEKIIEFGKWYATNYIYGKDYHRYDLSTYMSKVENFYAGLVKRVSISNPFILISIVLCIAALIVCVYLIRKRHIKPIYKGAFIILISLDLFAFSFYGTGFRGNIKNFEFLIPNHPLLFYKVVSDKGLFRILPYGAVSERLPNWARPNSNAIYGIDSIAAYSPLVARSYREKIKSLEVVDDALGLLDPAKDSLQANKDIIRLLNVKYIVSQEEITENFVKKIDEENGIFLYEFKNALPRGFIIRDLEEPVKIIGGDVEILKYRSGYALFSLNAPAGGFFVFSEFNYPGWQTTIDGKRVDIQKFQDILMAVPISKGSHKIEFRYQPFKLEQ